jgi:hypothetical protein
VICRQNYLDVKQWLTYLQDAKLLSSKTITKHHGCIRRLLEWADDVRFPEARDIRPVYPAYLQSVPMIRNYKPLVLVLQTELGNVQMDHTCLVRLKPVPLHKQIE